MSQDWLTKSAADLGRGIEAGQICPVALAEAFLDAAALHPSGPRIYARMMPERAKAEALAARERARGGMRRGRLDGVPISWKDLFDTAGVLTEAGSAVLKGRTPERDAAVVQALSGAGTICLGKTHMTEFAYSGLGLNPVTATPPCINDQGGVPGGSSSGAAASVAFGLAAVGMGSDTGGSVRIPAAWNDLVGLKTTAGRISTTGVVPLARRFDTVGPLTRTVEDATLVLAALENRRAPDPGGLSLAGRRLLVLEGAPFEDIRDQPAQGFEDAVARLSAAGAIISRARLAAVEDALALSAVIYTPECYAEWRAVIEPVADLVFPPTLARFRAGADHSAVDYISAWSTLEKCRAQYLAATEGFDAVILPTAANMPPNAARLLHDHAYFTTENLLTLRNTRIGNMLGLCALTLPAGSASVGLSLMMPPMAEDRLLQLGALVEAVLGAR